VLWAQKWRPVEAGSEACGRREPCRCAGGSGWLGRHWWCVFYTGRGQLTIFCVCVREGVEGKRRKGGTKRLLWAGALEQDRSKEGEARRPLAALTSWLALASVEGPGRQGGGQWTGGGQVRVGVCPLPACTMRLSARALRPRGGGTSGLFRASLADYSELLIYFLIG
jgi:hypothetical protein